jgi:hypothetical protein
LAAGTVVVYCSKCGHKNPDGAEKCEACQEPLVKSRRRKKDDDWDNCFGAQREMEDECFGLPQGSMIFTIIFGVIILSVGVILVLNEVLGFDLEIWSLIWPIFIILVGILILAGVLYRSRG